MSTGLVPYPRITMPIENVVFKQKKIVLDGYRFKNCAFIGCELETAVGNFELDACFFHAQTRFMFGGNAGRVAKLCSLMNYEISPLLRATVNPDGSVTIK